MPLGANARRIAAILSQRNTGGYGHEDGGEREEDPNNVRQFQSDSAIVAQGDPRAAPQTEATESGRSNRAAIPSLRAHKLIPARRDPLGTMPAIFIEILLCGPEPDKPLPGRTNHLIFSGPSRNVS